MRKAFFSLLIVVFFFFISSGQVHTASSFNTEIHSDYIIKEDYTASVTHVVRIENLTDFTYAPFFTMELEGGPEDIEVIDEDSVPIDFEQIEEDKNEIRIIFSDKNAGKGKVRNFTISYSINGIAQQKGQLREIYIPGISHESQISKKVITISSPSSWGNPSIVKPGNFTKTQAGGYIFDRQSDVGGGVLMIFGEEQFYEVNLTYSLKNPNIFPAEREIALPPTTSYQDVVIKEIVPYPGEMKIDNDGNWLASYLIPPNETITIRTKLFIRTHMGRSTSISDEDKKKYTKNDHYWEINSREVESIGKQLDDAYSIARFVVEKLSYDYTKTSSDKKRYGAKDALQSPGKAVCLEYSDLFIALARAKNIPARSIEGYAYSDNPSTRPLSLVKDVLHAWPEYYDESELSWKMIDPTWIDTTGGLDYFNSFDFDHIAFVIKGSNSRYPIPAGAYKLDDTAKDIQVELLDKDTFKEKKQITLTPHVRPAHFTLVPLFVDVTVRNSGDTKYEKGEITFVSKDLKSNVTAQFGELAPGEERDLRVRLTPRSILTKGNATITMRFGGEVSLLNINLTPYPPISWIAVGGIISVASAGFIIIARKGGYLHVPGFKRNDSVRR